MEEVVGSIPTRSTKCFNNLADPQCYLILRTLNPPPPNAPRVEGLFRYAPEALLPRILNNFTSILLAYFYSAPLAWFYSALDNWFGFSDLDRASAILAIHQSGISIRKIAAQLQLSESLLRHLVQALQAPSSDRDLAGRARSRPTNSHAVPGRRHPLFHPT